MAITDAQKVDYLYKKIGAGVAKTDTSAYKSPSNEANASPILTRGDTIWQQSVSIPAVKPTSNSSVVVLYQDSLTSTIECTLDTTVSGTNRTWLTNLQDWIGPEFGATYQVKVYAASAGVANAQTSGTQLFSDGSGNSDSWFFDYQAGILNFPDTNVPTALSGKKIYVVGARYSGPKGLSEFPTGMTIGDIAIDGNTITNGNLVVAGNLYVTGNTTFAGYSDLTITDSILNLHTQANLAPWTTNDGKDIGIKMHYYDYQDSHAALIRANDSGYLEWYGRGIEIEGNVFSGNAYGVIKTGELILANTTPTTGSNTGALQVYGGVSIGGNLYIAENITANTITVPGISSTAGNIATLYVENFSSGNAVITGGYIESIANAAIGYANITNLDSTTGYIENFSSANTIVLSGYADNFAIGGNVATTGRFTTVVTTDVTTVGGNLVANSGTASDAVTTGALVVIGGAGISGNVNAENVNTTEVHATQTVTTNLYVTETITVDAIDANTATIGNMAFANTTITHTDVFEFISNTAIKVPVGDTSERPTGVDGYLRFNTDTPALEYFDGNVWVPVTNTVTDQIITGDGTNNTFTLDQQATTVGTIVSINGTLQQPITAYSITGNQITFNEVPESTDIIDVRFLGAAVTINATLSDDLEVSGNVTATENITLGGILTAPQTTKAANDPGTVGQICWDDGYIYVCTATNTWKRTPLTGGY